MNNIGYYFRKLWWVGIIFLGIIFVIILFVISSIRNANANLEITTVPGDATVIIDDKKYGPGKITVSPGVQEIKAEREGFETATQKVTVTEDLQTFVFALTPVSEEAKSWANEHAQEYADAEAAGGVAAQQQGQALTDRYPLISRLPFDTSFYKINYAVEDRQKNTIYIRIDANSPMGRQVALDQIKEWGYQPTDYKIIFPGLANPLNPAEVEIQGE